VPTANSGSGGGGGSGGFTASAGADGVVILRYPDDKGVTFSGLTASVSAASGGYKRATITAGTGTVTFS
jgi:hypothetical protein